MAILNLADYIQSSVKNSTPQSHKSRWTTSEDIILHECIQKSLSLTDISKIIKLRSLAAICTRANKLGYGNKRNKDDGRTYFSKEINHKNRRTKDEILERIEKIPIKLTDSMGTYIEVDSVIIPKVEIAVADLDEIIKMLTTARSGYEQQRTSTSTN